MPIPDFQTLMLPLLKFSSDEKEHKLKEAVEALSNEFNLTLEERQQMLATGSQTTIHNRVSWCKTYLQKARLIDCPRRAYFYINERGKQVLASKPDRIDIKFLLQFPEYKEFRQKKDVIIGEVVNEVEPIEQASATPEEILIDAYQKIRTALALDLLEKVKECTPQFFERLVVELLVKMGYGGSIKDAGRATRLSNDGGIDGIIKEDKLGLDVIYIQAKKWTNNSVGRPDIQNFVGALAGMQANKGVFITTSKFAPSAIEYAKMVPSKIILIDGEQLADYMIDYGLGVSNFATYELKKIDNDYFGE